MRGFFWCVHRVGELWNQLLKDLEEWVKFYQELKEEEEGGESGEQKAA